MITRIVKMTFDAAKVADFITVFEATKKHIRGFEGCQKLFLLRDVQHPHIFFTYSHWQSEAHLNAYRDSALFADVWSKTKVLFAAKPEAWSTSVEHEL